MAAGQEPTGPTVFLGSGEETRLAVKLEGGKVGAYERFFITVKGGEVSIRTEKGPARQVAVAPGKGHRALGLSADRAGVVFMNVYVREL